MQICWDIEMLVQRVLIENPAGKRKGHLLKDLGLLTGGEELVEHRGSEVIQKLTKMVVTQSQTTVAGEWMGTLIQPAGGRGRGISVSLRPA